MTNKKKPPKSQDSASLRRSWLGTFLRAKRESLQPADVGLPTTERRRTPGLRREEVATLASVGVTWYTWLEQGRDITVSTPILDSIASALRLEGQELEHLYMLAGKALPEQNIADRRITEVMERLLATAGEIPAYIADRYWNIIAVNELGRYIFGLTPESNCLVKFFTDEQYASRYPFRDVAADMMVAQFRQRAAAFPSDTSFQLIADDLAQDSTEFEEIWKEHRVNQDPHLEVAYDHPVLGRLYFDSVVLSPVNADDIMLFMYIARPETSEALERMK